MEQSAADRDHKAIEIVKDRNGVDQVLLQNRSGSSVRVSLLGGQVLSWKADNGEELLFISSKAMPTAVRGGIPICFPKFGYGDSLEQHGFAKNRMWVIENNPPPLHSNDSNDKTYIDLLLKPSADDQRVWPHDFEFRLRVALAFDGSLAMTSRIRNIDHKHFSFSIVHHPYFSVSDISDVRVEGLSTLYYIDNLDNRQWSTEQHDAVTIESKVDRVYLSTVEEIVVRVHNLMNRRTFTIKKEGLPDVVIWNPWRERPTAMAYFGAEEYQHMLCLGAASKNPIILNPGDEWTGKLELSFKR